MEIDKQVSETNHVSGWSPKTIGWLTLFFGFPNGLILAGINWVRLGLVNRGVFHLLMGMFSVVFIVGWVRDFSDWFRIYNTPKAITYLVIYLVVTLLIVVYLDQRTKKDLERLEEVGTSYKKSSWLSALVLIFVISLISSLPKTFMLSIKRPNIKITYIVKF